MNIAFLLRRAALAGSGLTFGTIAVFAAAAPRAVARVYGLSPAGVDGMSEFRAVFCGFWISLCVTMVGAARREAPPVLGHMCGLMLLLQAAGRVWSLAADGRPGWPVLAALAAELLAAGCILWPCVADARAPSMVAGP